MPKRIVDGEGVWLSKKLKQVQPEEFRAEFANLIPLALANGTFEADPERIWARVYAYNRPSITVEKVTAILDEFERVGLLRRWTDDREQVWGYWEGIDKPGRLPPASRLKHEATGPQPPVVTNAKPMANHKVSDGCIGFGSGFGLGSGSGTPANENQGSQSVPCETSKGTPQGLSKLEYGKKLCDEIRLPAVTKNIVIISDSVEAVAREYKSDLAAGFDQLSEFIERDRPRMPIDYLYFLNGRFWGANQQVSERERMLATERSFT